MLKKLGIVKSKTKGYQIFNDYIEPDFLCDTMLPSDYINHCWNKYCASGVARNNSLNDSIYELIISSLFIKEGILPLHIQAQVAFVPNGNFDAVLYTTENGSIGISMKTSLCERYKQADLKAIALKYLHRKAENYLFTMDKEETETVSRKIVSGDILGINKAILTTDISFNTFISDLKKNFVAPGKIDIITAVIGITQELVDKVTK